jgi:L-ascorbate metabolism protein UlaG (beta-lactamase superfamily)
MSDGGAAKRPDGRPWHHLPDGRFRNPPGSPRRYTTQADLIRFMLRHWRNRVPDVTLPYGHVLPEAEVLRQLDRQAGRDSVTWLGHACFLIRLAGRTILTDPYLGLTAGPAGLGPRRFAAPGLAVGRLPPIDLLLVSHNHYDHLDAPTLAALPGKERVEVLTTLGLARLFRKLGYARVHELDWYDSRRFDGIEVEALPAVHFSRRTAFDRNRSLWAGFALRGGGRRVYFSGDTAYGAVFREIGRRAGPFDLGIVGIGAYLPRRIMQSSHTTPEEALLLAKDVGAGHVLGMHWGTVVLTDEDPFEPPERFRRAALAMGLGPERAWLMAIGESRALPGPWPRN